MARDEKVLLKISPSDKVIYPWIISKGVALLAAAIFFLVFFFSGLLINLPSLVGGLFKIFLVILFVGAIGLMVYYDFLRKSYVYTITNKGVHFKGGIFWKFDKFVSYNKITNISSEQGLIEQIIKLSHVNIHTAGQLVGARGVPVPEIIIEGIPQNKAKKVLDLLRKKISK